VNPGYLKAMEDTPETPETEEHPESEPTTLEDGEDAPLDSHPELEQLHGIPLERDERYEEGEES
jgi:hypothetical protein